MILGTGCAVIDSSVLDSAVPLEPGKFKAISYLGGGLDQNRMIYSTNLPDGEYNQTSANVRGVSGLKFGLGITRGTELDLSSIVEEKLSGKLALKVLLHRDSTLSISMMPGVYRYAGFAPGEFNPGGSDLPFSGNYDSRGVELPLLITYPNTAKSSITLCAKIAYNRLQYDRHSNHDANTDIGTYNALISGLIASFRVKAWYFLILPEIGVYAYPVKNGKYNLMPILNLGVGIDFWK